MAVPLNRKVFPALSDFADPIKQELLSRFDRFGSQNVPDAVWARMISNVYKFYNNENEREFSWVLTSGILNSDGTLRGGFPAMYDFREDRRTFRPMPGITDLSVETTGQYGSVRKTTINWTAPDISDLEYLEPYFLRIGNSMFVDFGWSTADIVESIPNIPLNVSDRIDFMTDLFKNPKKLYEEYILPSGGKYDALLGRISNFSYTVNEDGSYNCTTEITALGELMLGLNLGRQREYTDETVQKKKTLKEYLEKDFEDDVVDKAEQGGDFGTRVIKDGSKVWISWGFFEDVVLKNTLSMESGVDGSIKTFELDSSGVLISNDRWLFSTDADEMLLAKANEFSPKGNVEVFDAEFLGDPYYSGIMRNIYISTKLIRDELGEAETFQSGIENILNRISNNAMNLWEFAFYVDSVEDTKLKVIDVNYTNDFQKSLDETEDYIIFNKLDGKGVIKNINLQTDMPQQLAVKFFVGRNKNDESDLVVNDDVDSGITTLFNGEGGDVPDYYDIVYHNIRPPADAPISDDSGEKDKATKKKNIENKLASFSDLGEDEKQDFVSDGLQSKNIDTGGTFYTLDSDVADAVSSYMRRKYQRNKRRHQVPLYPIKVDITLDGISGVLPGNVFRVANIPQNFYDNGVFQVMSVSHNVAAESWETTITAIYRIMEFSDRELKPSDRAFSGPTGGAG